jgi:membrane associated rhomboid family serine protease
MAALAAAELGFSVDYTSEGAVFRVPEHSAEAVRRELAEYERVNRGWPPESVPDMALRTAREDPLSGVLLPLLLVLGAVWTGAYAKGVPVFDRGVAATAAVHDGEFWRLITALTLHADLVHALGNAVCLAFLVPPLVRRFGAGSAWCLVLLSGVLGNAVAVALRDPFVVSLGASTAAFGALGYLAADRIAYWTRAPRADFRRNWRRAGAALVGALGVLSFLGTGARSDLGAHAFGFLWGLGLGIPVSRWTRSVAPGWAQVLAGGTAAGVVVLAWAVAAFLG